MPDTPEPDPDQAITVTTGMTPELAAAARRLLARALPAELVDDRFDGWVGAPGPIDRPPGFCAAVAPGSPDGELNGWLGGSVSRGRLQLDGLIDPARPWPAALLRDLLEALSPLVETSGAGRVELWGRPAQPWHEAVAAAAGLAPCRSLHQMRCPLPVSDEAVPTRALRVDDPADRTAVLAVNNRAFATHPDQGGQSEADFAAALAEPWFRAEGLRVFELDGRVAGFCWTKIHDDPDPDRRLGEIYVIGVDPDFHGRGLGRPMTAAGLHWLADQGLRTGMLYVEAENEPAVRTYRRLGFDVVRTDRAWDRPLTDPTVPADPTGRAGASGAGAGGE